MGSTSGRGGPSSSARTRRWPPPCGSGPLESARDRAGLVEVARMGASLFWGAISASSLLIEAVLGVRRTWNPKVLGLVLGFGAGALIAGISFQLARGGYQAGGPWPLMIGLAAGALVFFFADRAVAGWAIRTGGIAGLALALCGLLDGIPEQAVLGIQLSHGSGVSLALPLAIFVSNLPESIGSSTAMYQGGKSARYVL